MKRKKTAKPKAGVSCIRFNFADGGHEEMPLSEYEDFLNRQAHTSGFNFWTGVITSCGSTASCIDAKRSSVSAAFFLAIEFQGTGYEVIRMYKATFTDSTARPRGLRAAPCAR